MINIQSIKAIVESSNKQKFGFDYKFKPGLNILSGDNSSGKSTVLSCIYYCLGMEQLASYGNSDGLKECLKSSFKYDNTNYTVFSSYAELHLTNKVGDVAIIKRIIKSAYNDNTNTISVKINNDEAEEKFVHASGDTDHEKGFYRWLSEYSEISIPIFTDEDGSRKKILYLQQIFASSFVEQTKGWSDFFAQIPVFNTKKAKQKIIEYTLGLSGLIEEFELDKLKEREKEFKVVWSNTVDAFQAVASYNNFLTANLSETFSIDFSPKKIEKLALQTRKEDGNYESLDEIIKSLETKTRTISKKNEQNIKAPASGELMKKHAEVSKKLLYLSIEYQEIETARTNEEIKVNKYKLHVEQLNREVEALEGIKKLNDLESFKVGSVENCPVCNSSLLHKPDIKFTNINLVDSINSLSFYKSERNLYESYLKSSQNLISRFTKTLAYYEERISEIKDTLTILDRQVLEDARIPSRIDISEEIRLKFELGKMEKINTQFTRFKRDLIELTDTIALIRNRQKELKRHVLLDEEKVLSFKLKFVEYLKNFGYSQEILHRITISDEESNKLFPVVYGQPGLPPQPIRLVSSASDFIRAQWAFYITLLVKAKFHLGILILDEPGQHAIASADLIQLLKTTSAIKDRQIIVAISKEDKIKTSTSADGESTQEVTIDLLSILEESDLIEKTDYTLNMIEGHSRKDKCIQPIE